MQPTCRKTDVFGENCFSSAIYNSKSVVKTYVHVFLYKVFPSFIIFCTRFEKEASEIGC